MMSRGAPESAFQGRPDQGECVTKIIDVKTTEPTENPQHVKAGKLYDTQNAQVIHTILKYFCHANETRLEDNRFTDRGSLSSDSDMFAGIRARSRSRNRYRFKGKRQ